MANEKLIHAIDTFQAICGHLDAKGWHYQKDEEHLVINTTVSGDDLPMNLLIDINEEQQRISVVSQLPLTFDEDKRVLAAVALGAVNDRLLNGAFDIELKTGKVYFY